MLLSPPVPSHPCQRHLFSRPDMLSVISCSVLVALQKMGCLGRVSPATACVRCHVHHHVRVLCACAVIAGLFFLWTDNILTLNHFLPEFRSPWTPFITTPKQAPEASSTSGTPKTALQRSRAFVDERLLPPPRWAKTVSRRGSFLLSLQSFFSSRRPPSGRGVTLTSGALFAHSALDFAADLAALHGILSTDAAAQARSDRRQVSSQSFSGDVTAVLPPVSLVTPVSPSEPLPGVDYPATRVFMLYVPRAVETGSGPLVLVDQAFGFIESWRYTFSVRQEGSKEPLLPAERLPPDFETDPEDPFHGGPMRKGMLSWNRKSGPGGQVSREQAGSSQRELHRLGDKGQEGAQEARSESELTARTAPAALGADSSAPAKENKADEKEEEDDVAEDAKARGELPRARAASAARSGDPAHEDGTSETLWRALKTWWSGREVGGSTVVDTPVINDVLMVVDPGMDRRHVPWICDELADLGGLSGYRADLQRRLARALEERRRRRLFSLLQGAVSAKEAAGTRLGQERDDADAPDRGSRTSPWRAGKRERDLPRHRCIVVRVMLDETQLSPVWNKHPAMHSVSALTHPVVEWMMMQYDLGMRSDNDTFLCPALLSRENTPWIVSVDERTGEAQFAFYTGKGAYNTDKNRLVLAEYSRILKLRHQHVFSIGSTWYGRPADIVRAARLTVKVRQELRCLISSLA